MSEIATETRRLLEDAVLQHQAVPVSATHQPVGSVATSFIELGGILVTLLNPEWQVIYGAPGTGKTTLLRALQERHRRHHGDLALGGPEPRVLPVYISVQQAVPALLRTSARSDVEKAHAYFLLFLERLGQELVAAAHVLSGGARSRRAAARAVREILSIAQDPAPLFGYFDQRIEEEIDEDHGSSRRAGVDLGLRAGGHGLGAAAEAHAGAGAESKRARRRRITRSSPSVPRLPQITRALERLAVALKVERVVLLLDNWSALDDVGTTAIQPTFAQLLRNAFEESEYVSVKIATDGYQTRLWDQETSFGFRPGSGAINDIANLNEPILDDETLIAFFERMLFLRMLGQVPGLRRFIPLDEPFATPSEEFVGSIFADRRAFELLVKGCEGRPRQFLRTFNHLAHLQDFRIHERWTADDVLAALDDRTALQAREIDQQPPAIRFLLLAVKPVVVALHKPVFVVSHEHILPLRPLLEELHFKGLVVRRSPGDLLPKWADDRHPFEVRPEALREWERAARFEAELAGRREPLPADDQQPTKLTGDGVEAATLPAGSLVEWLVGGARRDDVSRAARLGSSP